MAALYLTEQGSKLRKKSQRLVVEKGGTTILKVPAHGIGVSFLSMNVRLKGKLTPVESRNVFLRLAQYDRYKDEAFRYPLIDGSVQTIITILFYNASMECCDYTQPVISC
jgi:CRISPR/Cas system-associated endonuclease Cas1